MNQTKRSIAQRPAPGYYDLDLAGELGVVGHWVLAPEYNGSAHRAGYTAYGQCGNSNDGTLGNMDPPTDWGPGWLDWDGSDDNILVTDARSIQNIFDGGGAISAIIAPDSEGEGGNGRIVVKGDAAGWIFYQGLTRRLIFLQDFSGGIAYWWTDNLALTFGEWQHVAVVYDNLAANDPIFYVNGQIVPNTQVVAPSGIRETDVGADLYIGNNAATSKTYDGRMAQVILHDLAPTAQQIASMHAEPFKFFQRPLKKYFLPAFPLGGPFPHYTRRRMTGGMITLGAA